MEVKININSQNNKSNFEIDFLAARYNKKNFRGNNN